jgi:hypothetical protein
VQHERLALKLGFRENWIREVMSLGTEGPRELSEAEVLVEKLTLAIVERKGHDTTGELNAVVKAIGHEQAVGVLLLIGRYVMHALISNCLALKPPVASPLTQA